MDVENIKRMRDDFNHLMESRERYPNTEIYDMDSLSEIELIIRDKLKWFSEYKQFVNNEGNNLTYVHLINTLRIHKISEIQQFIYLWKVRRFLRRYKNYVSITNITNAAKKLNEET